MKFRIEILAACLALLVPSAAAIAQFAEIQKLPDQVDRKESLVNGPGVVVEAANGDLVVVYVQTGVWLDLSSFPGTGIPAQVISMRTSDGGATWSAPDTVLSAIDPYGVQGIGKPSAEVLPSGRIVLQFYYLEAPFPNYSAKIRTYHSDDHGATFTLVSDEAEDAAAMAVSPSGLLVAVVWRNEGDEYWTTTSADDGVTWSSGQFLANTGPICTLDLHTASDTEWTLVYADCWFGPGGTNTIYRRTTSDGGVTWSDREQVGTSASGYGTLGSLLSAEDGTLWLVYSSWPVISYQTSQDAGETWSAAIDWTGGTTANRDLPPSCSMTSFGPLCLFAGIRDGTYHQVHIGVPGLSADPLVEPTAAETETIPGSFDLDQNYPNPFNPSTTISFQLEEPAEVLLSVHDQLGREVAELASGRKSAGSYRVSFDAADLPSGVYLYRLQVGADVETKRMMLVK